MNENGDTRWIWVSPFSFVGPVGLEPTTRGLKERAVSCAEANRNAPVRTSYDL